MKERVSPIGAQYGPRDLSLPPEVVNNDHPASELWHPPHLVINTATREVFKDGRLTFIARQTRRTNIELAVLLDLANHAGEDVTAGDLFGIAVFAGSNGDPKNYGSMVGGWINAWRIRLGDDPKEPKIITRSERNIRPTRYRLNAEVTIINKPKYKERQQSGTNGPRQSFESVDPQEIARLAAQRNSEAFAELYLSNLSSVYRFVFFKIGDEATANDLVSEVFAKAWEGVDRFQWRDLPFRHWLLRMARNVVVDHWRENRRFNAQLDTSEGIRDGQKDPSDIAIEHQEVDGLRRALGKLADDQRDVLILRFIEGFSHADTARVLGKTENAVRQI